MTTRVTLKMDRLPAVIEAIPKEVDTAIEDISDALVDIITSSVWVRHGFLRGTVDWRNTGEYSTEVTIGWYLGAGFYSGFQEFGTSHQVARPIVRPAAHLAEPIFASYVEQALKKASKA